MKAIFDGFLLFMELTSPKTIKELLKKHRAVALKRLGQNFLIDKKVLRKIIEAAKLSENDTALEIGPGIGNLTTELAKKTKKVIAIEKDPKMVEILKETLKDFKNVEIIQDDILKIENCKLKIKNFKVVANLPYYIVSPVIRKFLESDCQPKEMILMVQKEVGQRICAKPPDMNLLAVSVQIYAEAKIIFYISKKSFWPQPKVDSAIIQIAPLINADRKLISADLFFRIVKAGFSQPRKQIINNLSQKLKISKEEIKKWLLENNIQPSQRAETLDIEDWINLTKTYKMK